MAEKKAHEVEGWLKRPDPLICLILLYGPDRGLVSERASAFARSTGLALDDPFSVIRLDGSEIEKEPEKLQIEAGTVPMFGGDRLIWIRNAGQGTALANEIKALCENPPPSTRILIEAGELKKGTGMRGIVERARPAMALPCYADEGRALDTLIDQMLGDAGLRIGSEARQVLKANLGGDRLATRGELEKLTLYAAGADEVTREDVLLATGNAADTSLDQLIDALLDGDRSRMDALYGVLSRGGGLGGLPTFLQRQFQQLELLAQAVSKGTSASSAVAAARPPIFFSRRKTIERALARWSAAALSQANLLIFESILKQRENGPRAAMELHRLLLQMTALPSR